MEETKQKIDLFMAMEKLKKDIGKKVAEENITKDEDIRELEEFKKLMQLEKKLKELYGII